MHLKLQTGRGRRPPSQGRLAEKLSPMRFSSGGSRRFSNRAAAAVHLALDAYLISGSTRGCDLDLLAGPAIGKFFSAALRIVFRWTVTCCLTISCPACCYGSKTSTTISLLCMHLLTNFLKLLWTSLYNEPCPMLSTTNFLFH